MIFFIHVIFPEKNTRFESDNKLRVVNLKQDKKCVKTIQEPQTRTRKAPKLPPFIANKYNVNAKYKKSFKKLG